MGLTELLLADADTHEPGSATWQPACSYSSLGKIR